MTGKLPTVDAELLREALLDLEQITNKDKMLREESEIAISSLRAGIVSISPLDALTKLLISIRDLLGAETTFVLSQQHETQLQCISATDTRYLDSVWPLADHFKRAFQGSGVVLYNCSESDEWKNSPAGAQNQAQSAMYVALGSSIKKSILVCAHSQPAYFNQQHLHRLERMALVASQILHQVELAQQFEAMEQKVALSERMTALGTLSAGIAHEINNPLAYVMGNLELLGEALNFIPKSSDTGKLLQSIEEGLRRISVIVNGLKGFSVRSDENSVRAIELVPCLEGAINMSMNEIKHRAELIRIYEPIPCILANETKMSQVFLNLLMNAAQAIPEGHADKNRITVKCTTDSAGRAVIEISDTGIGISKQNMKRLFEPFFTTKPVGSGTGLGLSICSHIVNEYHGELILQSEEGKGTTARLIFPSCPSVPMTTTQEVKGETSDLTTARRGKVLVVDDEQGIVDMLKLALQDVHEVTVSTDSKAAFERIKNGEHFDAILLDMMMPVLDGLDFYEALNKIAPEQASRVIFMTGGSFTVRVSSFLEGIQNPKMGKPFKIRDIKQVLQKVIDNNTAHFE